MTTRSTVADLVAAIPKGDEFSDLRDVISLIGSMFPGELPEITAERVAGWVADIKSGKRDEGEIRGDILEFVVTPAVIQSRLGVTPEVAAELIAGTKTFAETPAKTKTPGTVPVGEAVIPRGGTLVKVRDPEGTDSDFLYFVTYDVRGMKWSFEVGDQARFEELFGSESNFDSKRTVSQAQFDDEGFVSAGSIDQQLNQTESLESQFEQDLRDLGLEDMPEWLAGSPEALQLIATAAAQSWSSGRLWKQLATTQAFDERFGEGIKRYLQGGVSVEQAVNEYVADENALRSVMRRHFPIGTEVTNDYLGGALANGWTPEAAEKVLISHDSLRRRPNALAEANAVLKAAGIGSIGEVEFINAINGFGQADVVEAINTAAAAVALKEAGLDDVDTNLLLEVVDTADRVLTVDSFKEIAQQLSFSVAQNAREIGVGSMGISRDSVIAAMFGEADPEGRTPGEVLNVLARFERDRQQAAQGTGANTGFQDEQGRLRIAGVRGL